jgi:hypothetical protein
MITKPALQKILKGTLHTENQSKHSHKMMGIITISGGEQTSTCRVAKNQLHTHTHIHTPLHTKNNKMSGITTYLSTLNVNTLSIPIKRHQLTSWIKKEDHSWVPMAHVCNPTHSGGKYQDDCCSKLAWANSS